MKIYADVPEVVLKHGQLYINQNNDLCLRVFESSTEYEYNFATNNFSEVTEPKSVKPLKMICTSLFSSVLYTTTSNLEDGAIYEKDNIYYLCIKKGVLFKLTDYSLVQKDESHILHTTNDRLVINV